MSTSPSETVTRALAALYTPAPADADADGTRAPADLDTAASLLAADPAVDAVDAELDRRGREFIAAAWRRGWQPADLIRVVRRDLDDVHLGLVAELIRAQAPDDRPRGPRWAAQIDALEPGPRGPRTDRFSRATATLELFRLLLHLPALEPLESLGSLGSPGTPGSPGSLGGARVGASGVRGIESRMLTRIRALLAKAEATDFPEEAEALSAKAQELMARHSLDEALLSARGPAPDSPTAWRIGVEPPYEQAKAVLLDAVATANHCRAVWNEPFGFTTVVGYESDLAAVELLHTSLLVQATTAMTKAEAAQRKGGRRRTKTFRQSFLAAYAHRIGTRLTAAARAVEAAEAAEAAEADSTADLLPLLASRAIAVTATADHLFPETTTTRLRGVTDASGWTEGTRAADRAKVTGP